MKNIDYSVLNSEIRVIMKFRLLSGLRVGGTDPENELILKITGERPLVKDSSFRGVLRSEVERVCPATRDIKCKITEHTCDLSWPEILFGVADLKQEGRSLSFRGAVTVSDILFANSQTEIRHHVTMDNKSRSVGSSGPFSQEVIPPDNEGEVEISIVNITEETPLKYLFFAIEEIGRGNVPIGGRSTIGLGRIEATEYQIRLWKRGAQFLSRERPLEWNDTSLLSILPRLLQELNKSDSG